MSSASRESSLPGTGTLDVYSNFSWTVHRGSSSMDLELRDSWDNCSWEILDLVLIMDCTGSMSAWMDHCKATLNTVIDNIVKENEKLKVRVAFVGFRDFTDSKIFAIHDLSFDVDGVKGFISSQTAAGGGDAPEDVVGALAQAMKLSWFPGSVRLAALIADAPTHGNMYHDLADDFPGGSPAGLDLEQVVLALREKCVDLSLYRLNDTTEKMYSIMEKAGAGGQSQGESGRESSNNWVSFVDLRTEVTESRSRGLELSSRFMSNAYSKKSSDHMSERYRSSSSRSTNPSR